MIPYTRQQYLDMPRKKKKTVQMNVKYLNDYRDTWKALNEMMSKDTSNPHVVERIELLENQLIADVKALPKSPEWSESIQRLKK